MSTKRASNRSNALSVLDKIRPHKVSARFLQHWDPSTRRLFYGFGDGERGVIVGSDKSVTVADVEIVNSRHNRATVDRWLENAPVTDGRQLFDQIKSVLVSFVHFDDPRVADLVTLRTMGTYLYAIFSHYGYLFVHSTRKRSGKTRVMEVLSHLAFEATVPLNAPTVAVIREIAAEGRTLQLDTLERWKGKSTEAFAAAMDLLDAGYRNGSLIPKMVPSANSQTGYRQVYYPVYAPYTMAAIRKDSLHETALDRAFVIEMYRKADTIRKQPYYYHQVEKKCAPIRSNVHLWALSQAAHVARMYESKEVRALLEGLRLNDRAADIWRPMFAIARALGIDTSDLEKLAREMGRDPEVAAADDRELSILNDLLSHVRVGESVGLTLQIRKWLSAEVSASDLHDMLTRWGFRQKNHWIEGESRRAWALTEAKLWKQVRELAGGGHTLRKSDQTDHEARRGFSPRTRHAVTIQ